MIKIIVSLLAMGTALSFSQNQLTTTDDTITEGIAAYKFSISTTWLSFDNFGPEETNVHMFEFHFGYKITPNDKVGITVATWKLFEPMGIPLWDPLLMKKSEWYPGRLKESGIGVTYQRILWKGLFTSIGALPLFKTYFDENNNKIGNGFKLYTTYHLGYHLSFFENRVFIEPQIHCNYWPIDTNIPNGFKEKEGKWNNYFLFEPNIFFGVKI